MIKIIMSNDFKNKTKLKRFLLSHFINSEVKSAFYWSNE